MKLDSIKLFLSMIMNKPTLNLSGFGEADSYWVIQGTRPDAIRELREIHKFLRDWRNVSLSMAVED